MPGDAVHNAAALGVAAEHATSRVPLASPNEAAGDVRHALVGKGFECADDLAVIEDGLLVGIVPLEVLLRAPADIRMESLMDDDPTTVAAGVGQEAVAWEMVHGGASSVGVVDAAGRFVGLVPPHRMLAVLLAEHDEDLARLGGYLAGSRRARLAAEESVPRRLWHRLPWLLIGLLGAMASAAIVGVFEGQLQTQVLLAFFIPGVVYMADAVGTQTEAVLIRGMSVGVSLRTVLRRELVTGAVIGLVVATAFLPFALAVWGNGRVAVAVALALLASCSIATLVAMTLPWLFQRLGRDPAFGSGPVSTVIQDVLSIAVYFAIASRIAT